MYANVKKYVLKGLKVWLCHYLALMTYYARKIDKPSLKKKPSKNLSGRAPSTDAGHIYLIKGD